MPQDAVLRPVTKVRLMEKSMHTYYVAALLALGRTATSVAATTPVDNAREYRQWIEDMKSAPRGPFSSLRWFCNDGTVHPPKP
jgi:hypothetical protein